MVTASNPGPFTLDGTRTHLVGRERVAVVDPGPDDRDHLDALLEQVADATSVVILVTHSHEDHAGGAPTLARELDAEVVGYGPGARPPDPKATIETDQGHLRPVETPGHAREHLAFHWPRGGAIFPGDLILGQGDTTWVGAYPGCVADYLESLEALRALGAEVIYPAHGPPVRDVPETLERYESHRRERIRQVEQARAAAPGATAEELVRKIYGNEVPHDLMPAARKSVEAILVHLDADRTG